MHDIEPYYNWRSLYDAAEDNKSPFFGRIYSEFEFSNAIYDHFIHPQWDEFGSHTLYLKLLYVDYDKHFCIIELIGEWNDALYNDIMYFYRNVIEILLEMEINHFILLGDNVLEYHSDISDYYEEWYDNLGDGWIVGLNFRNHILKEFCALNIDYYIAFGGGFNAFNWRKYQPDQLFKILDSQMTKRLTT